MSPKTLEIAAPVQNNGDSFAGVPWQERPAGSTDICWRLDANPIITQEWVPEADGICNSAVVPFQNGYAGVFRVDDNTRLFRLHSGFSKDGIHWDITPDPIDFRPSKPGILPMTKGYDPRVCWIEDRYYVSWCNDYHGPTIGLAWTKDFAEFHQLENAFLPHNRNGVLFPRKINGHFAMLSRPSDPGQTPFGDIFYSESPDLELWGRHRFVMGRRRGWEKIKIGPGPLPIETPEGWLLFYHGVFDSCNGWNYCMGAALLDLDEPWKVLYRSRRYLLSPREDYERTGTVPNVVFPCAALYEEETGRIAIYYGAADSRVCLAFVKRDEVLDWIKVNDPLP